MSDLQFHNMENFQGGGNKFGLTIQQIIMIHIQKIVQLGSVEYIGGYHKTVFHTDVKEKVYVSSTAEVFCNAVEMLRALLLGYYDKNMQEKDNAIQDKLNELPEEADKEKEQRAQKVKCYKDLFQELVGLCKNLNFFQETATTESIE